MIGLVVEAVAWDGRDVPASITATADGVPLEGTSVPFTAFLVPAGSSSVTITATPSRGDFHAQTAELIVEPDGTLTAVVADLPTVRSTAAVVPGIAINRVSLVVSRLLDVSAQVCELLADQPAQRQGMPEFQVTGQGDFPPASWELPDRAALPFVDLETPLLGDIVYTVEQDVSGGDLECAVFRLAGSGAVPALLAVSWPRALLRGDDSPPTPFLVYYHPGAGQNVADGYYANNGMPAYPMNFDYAYHILYKYQWYEDDPLTRGAYSKGIPFQVAASGKQIASVIPCNIAGGSEFGLFMSAAAVEEILLDLQALMFRRAGVGAPPATLGRTALAAFSSGNHFLGGMIGSAPNRQSRFLAEAVREVYLFDPPDGAVDSITASCLAWAGEDADRRVALYARGTHPAHRKLLGRDPPAAPFIAGSGPTRTAAVLPTDTWRQTVVERSGPVQRFTWQDAHQRIAALMLTHAVGTSGF